MTVSFSLLIEDQLLVEADLSTIFQCHIFLPFHTVNSVLKARILKRFAIPFFSGPHFVRILHHDLSVLGGPTWLIVSLS